MSLLVQCSCGKKLKVPEQYAGKRVKCPSCSVIVAVAEKAEPALASATPRVVAAPSTPRPPMTASATPFDELNDSGPRPVTKRRSDSNIRRARPAGGKSWLIYIFVAEGVALLAVGVGIAWMWSAPSEPKHLSYVPNDAQAFASLRVAEVWRQPIIQKAIAQRPKGAPDPAAEAERVLGVGPAEIERATLVVQDAEQKTAWLIATAAKPFDRDKILKEMKSDGKESRHAGKVFFTGSGEKELAAIHFVTPRTLILSSTDAMKVCLDQPLNVKPTGPLVQAHAAANGKSHIAAGFALPAEKMKGLKSMAPPSAQSFVVLLDALGGRASINIGDELDFNMAISFPDADTAKQAKSAMDAGLVLVKGFLAEASVDRPGVKVTIAGMDRNSIKALLATLDKITFEQADTEVNWKWKTAIDVDKAGSVLSQGLNSRGGPATAPATPRQLPKNQPAVKMAH